MVLIIMTNTDTAIIILSYNKIRQTRECIDSILSSEYDQRKVFCFDNGSKLEVYNELKSMFPAINHKRVEKNTGYSGGFNRAMEWVFSAGYQAGLFLTNDTRIVHNTLFEIIKTAEKTNAGIIAPSIYYLLKPDVIDSTGGYFDPVNVNLHHYKDMESERLDKDQDYIPGTAMWITKKSFGVLNGMDEIFHTYWEDVDFSFRARKNGVILARSKNGRILHGVGKTCHKKPEYTTYYFQRNRILFCKKNFSGGQLNTCLSVIKNDLVEIKKKLEEKMDLRRLKLIDKVFKEL